MESTCSESDTIKEKSVEDHPIHSGRLRCSSRNSKPGSEIQDDEVLEEKKKPDEFFFLDGPSDISVYNFDTHNATAKRGRGRPRKDGRKCQALHSSQVQQRKVHRGRGWSKREDRYSSMASQPKIFPGRPRLRGKKIHREHFTSSLSANLRFQIASDSKASTSADFFPDTIYSTRVDPETLPIKFEEAEKESGGEKSVKCSLCNLTDSSCLAQAVTTFSPKGCLDSLPEKSSGDERNLSAETEKQFETLSEDHNIKSAAEGEGNNIKTSPIKKKEKTGLARLRQRNKSASIDEREKICELIDVGFESPPEIREVFSISGETYGHYNCVIWSEGVDKNCEFSHVEKAVLNGMFQKCLHCDKYGATIRCNVFGCDEIYHYPCAVASDSLKLLKSGKVLCMSHLDVNSERDIMCLECKIVGDVTDLLMCSVCYNYYHGKCLESHIQVKNSAVKVGWQCADCRICETCRESGDENKMLVCETCDKSYHSFCIKPAIAMIPKSGWKCQNCRICGDCGARSPGNGPSSRWHLNYTVCDSCYQQRNKGIACPLCGRAYRRFSQRKGMHECMGCRKYIHAGCDPRFSETEISSMDYLCPVCADIEDYAYLAEPSKEENRKKGPETIVSPEVLLSSSRESFSSENGGAYSSADSDSNFALNDSGSKLTSKRRAKTTEHRKMTKKSSKSKVMKSYPIPGAFCFSNPFSEPKEYKTDDDDQTDFNKMILASQYDEFVLCQDLCVMCGSYGAGEEADLIACAQCGECYHSYCAGIKLTSVVLTKGWRCLDCTVCEECGEPHDESRLLLCDVCDLSFHIYCLNPPLTTVPQGNWKCKWCVNCIKCGSKSPGINCNWEMNYTHCGPCASGTVCAACSIKYEEDELIIQCFVCNRWIHGKCDEIVSEHDAERCAAANYACVLCRPIDELAPHKLPEIIPSPEPEPTPIHILSETVPSPEPECKESIEEKVVSVKAKPPSYFFVDGVCLSESGFEHIKNLTPETPKKITRTRKPRHTSVTPGMLVASKRKDYPSVPAFGPCETSEGNASNSQENTEVKSDPDMKTDIDDFDVSPASSNLLSHDVEKKKRPRKIQKLGIGGFVVKPRGVRTSTSLPKEKDSLDIVEATVEGSHDAEHGTFPPTQEKPKRRRKPKKKTPLDERFPSYLRDAFFGKELLNSCKKDASPSLSEGDFFFSLEDGESEGVDPCFFPRDIHEVASKDTSPVPTPSFAESKEHSSKNQGNFSQETSVILSLSSTVPSNKSGIAAPKTAEEFTENFERKNEMSIGSSVQAESEDTMDIGRDYTSGIYAKPKIPGPPTKETYNKCLSGFLSDASNSPVNINKSETLFAKERGPTQSPSPVHRETPNFHHQDSNSSWSESETSDSSSLPKSTFLKWEGDENLGMLSTISPVLYANINCPNLKLEYPLWNDRVKQIAKQWRSLPSEKRQPYLQKARENRAASRTQKATDFVVNSSKETKTQESEHEKQWKQFQALRQLQQQKQQKILQEQRAQALMKAQTDIPEDSITFTDVDCCSKPPDMANVSHTHRETEILSKAEVISFPGKGTGGFEHLKYPEHIEHTSERVHTHVPVFPKERAPENTLPAPRGSSFIQIPHVSNDTAQSSDSFFQYMPPVEAQASHTSFTSELGSVLPSGISEITSPKSHLSHSSGSFEMNRTISHVSSPVEQSVDSSKVPNICVIQGENFPEKTKPHPEIHMCANVASEYMVSHQQYMKHGLKENPDPNKLMAHHQLQELLQIEKTSKPEGITHMHDKEPTLTSPQWTKGKYSVMQYGANKDDCFRHPFPPNSRSRNLTAKDAKIEATQDPFGTGNMKLDADEKDSLESSDKNMRARMYNEPPVLLPADPKAYSSDITAINATNEQPTVTSDCKSSDPIKVTNMKHFKEIDRNPKQKTTAGDILKDLESQHTQQGHDSIANACNLEVLPIDVGGLELDDDELLGLGNDFNILEYADPELDKSLVGEGNILEKSNILDEHLDFNDKDDIIIERDTQTTTSKSITDNTVHNVKDNSNSKKLREKSELHDINCKSTSELHEQFLEFEKKDKSNCKMGGDISHTKGNKPFFSPPDYNKKETNITFGDCSLSNVPFCEPVKETLSNILPFTHNSSPLPGITSSKKENSTFSNPMSSPSYRVGSTIPQPNLVPEQRHNFPIHVPPPPVRPNTSLLQKRPLLLQEQPLLLEDLVEQEKREKLCGLISPEEDALLSDIEYERLKDDVFSGPHTPDDSLGGPGSHNFGPPPYSLIYQNQDHNVHPPCLGPTHMMPNVQPRPQLEPGIALPDTVMRSVQMREMKTSPEAEFKRNIHTQVHGNPNFAQTPSPPVLDQHNEEKFLQYETFLIQQQATLSSQQQYLETEVIKLRKIKKALNAKQRQLRKNGSELNENDSLELARISQTQSTLQKQLEQIRKQTRQHALGLQDFRIKKQQKRQQMHTSMSIKAPQGSHSPQELIPPGTPESPMLPASPHIRPMLPMLQQSSPSPALPSPNLSQQSLPHVHSHIPTQQVHFQIPRDGKSCCNPSEIISSISNNCLEQPSDSYSPQSARTCVPIAQNIITNVCVPTNDSSMDNTHTMNIERENETDNERYLGKDINMPMYIEEKMELKNGENHGDGQDSNLTENVSKSVLSESLSSSVTNTLNFTLRQTGMPTGCLTSQKTDENTTEENVKSGNHAIEKANISTEINSSAILLHSTGGCDTAVVTETTTENNVKDSENNEFHVAIMRKEITDDESCEGTSKETLHTHTQNMNLVDGSSDEEMENFSKEMAAFKNEEVCQNVLLKQLLQNCPSAESTHKDIPMDVSNSESPMCVEDNNHSKEKAKKQSYLDIRRAELEKEATPPPLGARPKTCKRKRERPKRKKGDVKESSPPVRKKNRKRSSSKQDDTAVAPIDNENPVAQLINMPSLKILEPVIEPNFNTLPVFGTGDMNAKGNQLRGTYGNATLPNQADVYCFNYPNKCKDFTNARLTLLLPSPPYRGFYNQEFPSSPNRASTVEFGCSEVKRSYRDTERSPDTVVSSSSPESCMFEPLTKWPELVFIDHIDNSPDEDDHSYSPVIPIIAPIPIRLVPEPVSEESCEKDKENIYAPKIDLNETKKSKRELASSNTFSTPLKDSGNVSVTLTLSSAAAEDICNVLSQLAHLLKIPFPVSYDIFEEQLERTATPPPSEKLALHRKSKTTEMNMPFSLNGKPRFCRHCDIVVLSAGIKKRACDITCISKGEREQEDEIFFCSTNCYMQFALTHQSSTSALEDKETIVSHTSDSSSHDFSNLSIKAIDEELSAESPPSLSQLLSTHTEDDNKIVAANLDAESSCGRNIMQSEYDDEETLSVYSNIDTMRDEEKKCKSSRYKYYKTVPRLELSIEMKDEDIKEVAKPFYEIIKPKELPKDRRRCIFCHVTGDGETNGAARLLNIDVDRYVHLNCALWSAEVYETENGSLVNVETAYKRAVMLTCCSCHRNGASLKCFKIRCSNIYHFTCAMKESVVFYKDKTLLCPNHANKYSENELESLAVHRRVYIDRDEHKQVASMIQGDQYIMRIGSLLFLNLGQLLPQQMQAFHTPNCIYPIGYRILRMYWSMRNLTRRCLYLCTIHEVQGQPEFSVTVKENDYKDIVLTDKTAKGLWQKVLYPIEKMRRQAKTIKLFPKCITGDDLFGLTEPSVLRIVESLPGVDMLQDYNFRYGRSPFLELPLAINPTGSARSEPKLRTHVKRSHTLHTSNAKTFHSTFEGGMEISPYIKQFVHSKSSQFRRMKIEWRNNVYLARSRIQGLGLYAARDLEKHMMVIEYIGQLIRNEIAERNEGVYNSQNRGTYMFRLEENIVIDATLSGGLARYMNHSCNPNCVAEVVQIDKDNKILIIANRRIARGEELSYDYKFDIEDDDHKKIPCLCKAPNCRKWMN